MKYLPCLFLKKSICILTFLLIFPTLSLPDEEEYKSIITLMSTNAFAHACPCDGYIYTAAHVVANRNGTLNSFTWEDGYGNHGKATGISFDDYRDLGKLKLYGDKPHKYFPKASILPEKDDKVYWQEFDDKGFLGEVKKAEVLYHVAGYIFFDKPPSAGASGGCLFNEDKEVIGIVVAAVYKKKLFGIATIIIDY